MSMACVLDVHTLNKIVPTGTGLGLSHRLIAMPDVTRVGEPLRRNECSGIVRCIWQLQMLQHLGDL